MSIKKKTRGIVLIATGHPYYGRMAYNLCVTIKGAEPEMPVAVLFKGRALAHLSEHQVNIFDQAIEIPDKISESFGAKLYINELTPFDETLYLDADMLWLPKKTPSQLMDEFGDAEFTAITEGYFDLAAESRQEASTIYYFWADPIEIKSTYKLTEGRLYQWRSEVMFFRKSAKMTKFWKKAQAIHRKSGLKTSVKFGEHIPDELAINISAAIHDMHPHQFEHVAAVEDKRERINIFVFGYLDRQRFDENNRIRVNNVFFERNSKNPVCH